MVLSNEFYYERVQLDTINERFNKVPTAKEGDANGRGMIVVLTENGLVKNTTGVSLLFKWEHTRISGAQGLENFEALDLTKGEYKVAYPTEMNHEGYVKAEIRIIDNGKYAGSRNMKIQVEPSVGDDTAMESSNEFAALVTALVKTNHMENLLNETIANVTVDSEVITARNSTAKQKTFTVLDERMEDLEKDVYYPANNELTQADFAATTGWSVYRGTLAVANNVASVTGTSGLYPNVYQDINCEVGDKLYYAAQARVTTAGATAIALRSEGVEITTDNARVLAPLANQWYQLDCIKTAFETTPSFAVSQRYALAADATGKVLQVKKPIALNLTKIFGANAIPTIEQIRAILSRFTDSHFVGNEGLSQPALLMGKALSLEAQFNAAVAGLTVDGETINARVGKDNTTHATLKARLDSEKSTTDQSLVSLGQQLEQAVIVADTAALKADAMASGSPKGVYATVALLQAAYPTGTTGAYLVTADGNWYYWSGSAWTVGDLYQSGTLKNYKRALTAGDNLDTFFAEGAYLLTTATTPGTYPSGVSTYAIFEVEGTSNFITQKITNTVGYGVGTRSWVRSWQTSWGAWVELTNVTFKTYKRSLLAGDNIDTLLAEGQYWLNKATTTLGTYPTGLSTYSMLDIQSVGSNYVVQTLTNLVGTGKPRLFRRTYQTTWSVWVEIAEVADVDSTSIMAINTVTNSSFSSGLTGFAVGANIIDEAVVGDTLTFTGVGYSKSLPNTVQGGERTVAGHKYYISSFAKYTATPGSIILGVLEDGAILPLTTTLTRYSTIVTAVNGNYYAYTMAATTGTDITVQKPLSIDLTALFGAGNEPPIDLIDEMINTVAGGFEGTKNILTPTFVFGRLKTLTEQAKAISSVWNGKSAAFLGDSITEGPTVAGSYVPVVKELLGLATVYNYGIGGGRLCNVNAEIDGLYTPLIDRYMLIDTSVDIVFILIGTNDYASQVPIGATNSTNPYEFNGALNIMMDWFRTNMPDKLIIFSTQLHRFNDTAFTIKMDDYRNATKERCAAKKFVCYDAFENTGFDFVAGYYDRVLTDDGLHPNTAGNTILGRKIAGFINAQ